MLASGFTAAPVSQFLFFGVITSSILVSITDVKYLFYIQVVPHLWQYKQAWRLLIWQVCVASRIMAFYGNQSRWRLCETDLCQWTELLQQLYRASLRRNVTL